MKNPHSYSVNDVLTNYSTSLKGLTQKEIIKRQKLYGDNTITSSKKPSIIKCFISQLKDFMVVILLISAVLSVITSYLEGKTDFIDFFIIIAIIIVNAAIGTYQECKAYNSLEALKELSAPCAKVIRDNNLETIPAAKLVPGDIIKLESGDLVPADCRLVETCCLLIDESSLTGESESILKNSNILFPEKSIIGDHLNMAYASSVVTGGHATAIVTSIGLKTEVGKIAHMIQHNDNIQTPLQKQLDHTSKVLGTVAIIICVIICVLGITSGIPILDMFLTSVSLAVASIPEGLSIIVTIMLSLGVTRIANKHAIVRKLTAVETLGNATYICSDKTGTLTQNKMTVTTIKSANNSSQNTDEFIMSLACLCNNTKINESNSRLIGEPTEIALIEAGRNLGLDIIKLQAKYKRVKEYPFDSKKKMMSTTHKLPNGQYRHITKGAVDVILKQCTNASKNHTLICEQMAQKALRTIGIAYKDSNSSTLPKDMTLVGIIGMIDPPKDEVYQSIRTCKSSGITPVMITGDHPITACEVAKQIGISNNPVCLTGIELNSMPEKELCEKVTSYNVYARVSPYHKVRIVKALQANNQVVAMTGDGVNDAPALKAADIGCSMGKKGTEVAKSASDIILTDDNFSTIVDAIKEGRGIYDNIKKSIHFLLSSNIGEILTILIAILFHLPTPLLAVQLLWINLVTDSLPAIALGVEPPEADIMQRKPIIKGKSLFTKDMVTSIIVEGMLIGCLSLIAFVLGYKFCHHNETAPLETGRTMAFLVLGLSQLFHSFNMKSSHSILNTNIFNNKKLILSFIICVLLQLSVVYIPLLSSVFNVVTLSNNTMLLVFVLSFLPIPIVEIQKGCRNIS